MGGVAPPPCSSPKPVTMGPPGPPGPVVQGHQGAARQPSISLTSQMAARHKSSFKIDWQKEDSHNIFSKWHCIAGKAKYISCWSPKGSLKKSMEFSLLSKTHHPHSPSQEKKITWSKNHF